jgi:peptide deformylase
MPVLPIVRMGDPVLRRPAEPLAQARLVEPAIQHFIDDMVETMRDADGVGLAAPQVGEALQLFVYESLADGDDGDGGSADPGSETGSSSIPLHVVINPMVEPAPGELVYDWEGCLSIPDLRGLVPRHPAVRVRGLDREGVPLDYIATGFEARIVQHEFDHLNGVLFLDRMRDLRSLAFYDEWEAHLRGAADDPRALRPE